MPLQKSHPENLWSKENVTLTRNKAFPERRRTLQSVSELSPKNLANATNSQRNEIGPRRMRPQSGGFGDAQRMHTMNLVIPTAPVPIKRSLTTPHERKLEWRPKIEQIDDLGSEGSHRRLSFRLPRHSRASQRSNDPTFEQRARRKSNGYQHQNVNEQGKQSTNGTGQLFHPGHKVIQTYRPSGAQPSQIPENRITGSEDAAPAPRIERHRHKSSITLGSDSRLPSLSPMPAVKLNTTQSRQPGSQAQLLQNSKSIRGPRYSASQQQLSSIGSISLNRPTADQWSRQSLKRASTNSNLALSAQRSSPSHPHYGLPDVQSFPQPALDGLASIPGIITNGHLQTEAPPQYTFPRPPSNARLRDSRSPRVTHRTSLTPIRSTSTNSTTTQTSRTPSTARRGSSPAPRLASRSNRSLRHSKSQGMTEEHLDALAALTAPAPPPSGGMTAESRQFLEQQQRKLDEKIRRQSVASERSARMSAVQEGKKTQARRGSGGSGASYHLYPNPNAGTNGKMGGQIRRGSIGQSYRISTGSEYGPSSFNPSSIGTGVEGEGLSLQSDSLAGLTPESIRLLREREKLLRWKAAREKIEFERREREKIKERVKRANEMEEARSRELEKQKSGKKRGCCGLFG